MSIVRVEKTSDYSVMSNYHFKEREMSLKAKGLLSMMLSLPDNWDFSIAGLVAICKESSCAIRSTLNELKKFGYLEVNKKLSNETESGHFEYEYIIYEKPKKAEKKGQKPYNGNQHMEVEPMENPTQLNTNKLNTKELNTNNNIRKKESKKENAKTKPVTYDNIINEQEEEVQDNLREFIKMRQLIKKPLTSRGLELIIKRLNSLANNTEDKNRILEQSITNSWQGIFPLSQERENKEPIREPTYTLGHMVG